MPEFSPVPGRSVSLGLNGAVGWPPLAWVLSDGDFEPYTDGGAFPAASSDPSDLVRQDTKCTSSIFGKLFHSHCNTM